uniref:Uncharacterized protein ORF115_1 n=1 Tax=Nothoceros aenigmaticus TaxID=13813 RepID=C3RYL9_9EMBR|nr:hypothetical protein MeaeMp09 [Nothoceros aenigmaticus]ACC86776.1 hypothetical protein MeaeMp09 [Nothoceros aenigmaticus]
MKENEEEKRNARHSMAQSPRGMAAGGDTQSVPSDGVARPKLRRGAKHTNHNNCSRYGLEQALPPLLREALLTRPICWGRRRALQSCHEATHSLSSAFPKLNSNPEMKATANRQRS